MNHLQLVQVAVMALSITTPAWGVNPTTVGAGLLINQVADRRVDSALKLTIDLVDSKYCSGDAEVAIMRIKLRLHFVNSGKLPLILYKGGNRVSTVIVGRTIEDALKPNREIDLSFSYVSSVEPMLNESKHLDESFAVIQSGGSFETSCEVPIPFRVDDQSSPRGTIKRGEHVLQIRVVTWPESVELANALAAKWARQGILWYEVVLSEPMPFTIGRQVELTNCSKNL